MTVPVMMTYNEKVSNIRKVQTHFILYALSNYSYFINIGIGNKLAFNVQRKVFKILRFSSILTFTLTQPVRVLKCILNHVAVFSARHIFRAHEVLKKLQ